MYRHVAFRALVIGLFALSLTQGAASQNAPSDASALTSGTRVRVLYLPHRVPPDGAMFTGTLVSLGDTLTLSLDGGAGTIRLSPRDVDAFEVSAGRGRYPYWLPVATTAVATTAAWALIPRPPSLETCGPFECLGPSSAGGRTIGITVSAAVGLSAGLFAARGLASERWVPATRVFPTRGGASLVVPL